MKSKLMKTKIILHNSVSLDSSFIGFTPDMELHYEVVNFYRAEGYMAGSVTARTGLDMFGTAGEKEAGADLIKPDKDPSLSYWIIPDSKGILNGMLHNFRRFEFCRDVIILASETTPADYLNYLKEREYGCIVTGRDHVDYQDAFCQLSKNYGIHKILADTGSKLGNILLNEGLVDEISLIISPEITGKDSKYLFGEVKDRIGLSCLECKLLKSGYIWVRYEVKGGDVV